MSPIDFSAKIISQFGALVTGPMQFRDELTLIVSDPKRIHEVCSYAKKELGFTFLVDITGLDNLGDDPRFAIVYELFHLEDKAYIRLKTAVSESDPELPTVSTTWRTADWHEREIYDMLGIRFSGHPDLRRILMWDGYPYFPLRKDFPLAGKTTNLPDIAFTNPAPLEGGPFVTVAGGKDTVAREPRVRQPESDSISTNTRVERRPDVKSTHEPVSGPGPIKPQT